MSRFHGFCSGLAIWGQVQGTGSGDRTSGSEGARRLKGVWLRTSAGPVLCARWPGPARARRALARWRRFESRSGHELQVVRWDDGSVFGDDADRHWGAVAAAPGDPRWLLGDVAIAPLHQRQERDAQLAALLGEVVLEPLGPFAIADALDDPLVDESMQPIGQHVAGDAQAVEQLVETAEAENEVANDEQRPAVANELERAGNRAHLPFVV